MKKSTTLVLVLVFFYSSFSQSIGPSVINTAGGSSNSGYYQFEWSLGEMALIGQLSNPSNSLIVTNGLIQPYILKPGYVNNNNLFSNDEIRIFPNPASDYVEINFSTMQQGKITLNFFDAAGKKSYSNILYYSGIDLIERIPVSKLANGVYLLDIELEPYTGSISKKGIYKIVKIK